MYDFEMKKQQENNSISNSSNNEKAVQKKESSAVNYLKPNNVVQLKPGKKIKASEEDEFTKKKRIFLRTLFKKNPKYTYRSDSRNAEEIARDGGFKTRNAESKSTLLEHVSAGDILNDELNTESHGTINNGHLNTNFVSTASARAFVNKNGKIDNIFATKGSTTRKVFLYKISTKKGKFIDVMNYLDEKALHGTSEEKKRANRARDDYKNQREYASEGSIPLSQIVGYVSSEKTNELLFPQVPYKSESGFEKKFKQLMKPMPFVPNNNNQPVVQQKSISSVNNSDNTKTVQMKSNNTGLPDNLKSGIENMSGYSMDDVKVHYNSSKPAQMKALAYTQGSDIHVAPGQEQHLGHEAWHVVQQKQGRVIPTTQMKGVNVNDSPALELEADVMGNKAMQFKRNQSDTIIQKKTHQMNSLNIVQKKDGFQKTTPSKSDTKRNFIGSHRNPKDDIIVFDESMFKRKSDISWMKNEKNDMAKEQLKIYMKYLERESESLIVNSTRIEVLQNQLANLSIAFEYSNSSDIKAKIKEHTAEIFNNIMWIENKIRKADKSPVSYNQINRAKELATEILMKSVDRNEENTKVRKDILKSLDKHKAIKEQTKTADVPERKKFEKYEHIEKFRRNYNDSIIRKESNPIAKKQLKTYMSYLEKESITRYDLNKNRVESLYNQLKNLRMAYENSKSDDVQYYIGEEVEKINENLNWMQNQLKELFGRVEISYKDIEDLRKMTHDVIFGQPYL